MRGFILAAAAVAAIGSAVVLNSSAAEAMPLPDASALGTAIQDASSVESVALVCRRHWNGRRFVERCVRTRPIVRPAPRIYPRPYHPRRHYY